MLAASELKTSLQEKLQELIERFFGKTAATSETGSDGSDAEDGEAVEGKETDAKIGNGYAFSGMMWSMELFYSSSYVQSMGQSQNGAGSFSASSWSFSASASYSSFSGDFSQLTSSFLPQALLGGLSSFGQGGPFTSLLSGMGMTFDGIGEAQGGGYFTKLRESRNLMAELMELYGMRIKPKEVEATAETEEVGEAEEAPAESAAVE